MDLLWGHVAHGSAGGAAKAGDRAEGGHAEVGQAHAARRVDQYVVRLDVKVEHAVFVGEGKGVPHGVGDGRRLVCGEQAVLGCVEQLGQACTLDVLHDDVGVALVGLELEHRDHVGVRQHAGCARLGKGGAQQGARASLLHGTGLRVHVGEVVSALVCLAALLARPMQGDHLDGDAAHEAGVPAHRHRAEAALAALFEHPVATEHELGELAFWGLVASLVVLRPLAGCPGAWTVGDPRRAPDPVACVRSWCHADHLPCPRFVIA